MINKISIASFKTLENVSIELSNLNIFIGANGSGKSNLLEAIAVLSAAADGRVTDQSLLNRGVRVSKPNRYRSAFLTPENDPPSDLYFSCYSKDSEYQASFLNPKNVGIPGWIFKTEKLAGPSGTIFYRDAIREFNNLSPENGFAALKAVELSKSDGAGQLLSNLQGYAIYSPTTPILREIAPETHPKDPIGLSGGGLGEAFYEMVLLSRSDEKLKKIIDSLPNLIGWMKTVGLEIPPSNPPFVQHKYREQHPSNVITSPAMLSFKDRYMQEDRNILSGYEVSEGALYVVFLAVIIGHPRSPHFFAIDNADHALNPGLAKNLFWHFSKWVLDSPIQKQILITSHNPAVLDGLPLQDGRVRLFTVDRDNLGKTIVKRIELNSDLMKMAKDGWPLSRLWMNKYIGGMPDV